MGLSLRSKKHILCVPLIFTVCTVLFTGCSKSNYNEQAFREYMKVLERETTARMEVQDSMWEEWMNSNGYKSDTLPVEEVSYSLWDAGGDGIQEFAVRLLIEDTYSYFLFKYENEEVVLFEILCPYKVYSPVLYEYGLVEEVCNVEGYNGTNYSVIDSSGTYTDLFFESNLYRDIRFTGLREVNDKWSDPVPVSFKEYRIDNKEYYAIYFETNSEKEEKSKKEFLSLCNDQGILIKSEEEIEELKNQYLKSLNLPEKLWNSVEPEWISIPVSDMYSCKSGRNK